MEKKWILVVAAVFIAMILIGEAIAYGGGNSYDSSATRDGDTVSYSVSSSGTNDYTAILIDNHGFTSLKHLVIYVDENSGNNLDDACARGLVRTDKVCGSCIDCGVAVHKHGHIGGPLHCLHFNKSYGSSARREGTVP